MLHSFVVVCLFFSTFVCLPVVMAFNVGRPHHVDIKKNVISLLRVCGFLSPS